MVACLAAAGVLPAHRKPPRGCMSVERKQKCQKKGLEMRAGSARGREGRARCGQGRARARQWSKPGEEGQGGEERLHALGDAAWDAKRLPEVVPAVRHNACATTEVGWVICMQRLLSMPPRVAAADGGACVAEGRVTPQNKALCCEHTRVKRAY